MKNREELQEKLEELLGSNQVYYQTPGNINMKYPAIVYKKNDISQKKANNKTYISNTAYLITIISKKPDNNVINKILELPLSSYDRNYIQDNLYHDTIKIYI